MPPPPQYNPKIKYPQQTVYKVGPRNLTGQVHVNINQYGRCSNIQIQKKQKPKQGIPDM